MKNKYTKRGQFIIRMAALFVMVCVVIPAVHSRSRASIEPGVFEYTSGMEGWRYSECNDDYEKLASTFKSREQYRYYHDIVPDFVDFLEGWCQSL